MKVVPKGTATEKVVAMPVKAAPQPPSESAINDGALVNAIAMQRNQALDQVAMAAGQIAVLQSRLEAVTAECDKLKAERIAELEAKVVKLKAELPASEEPPKA